MYHYFTINFVHFLIAFLLISKGGSHFNKGQCGHGHYNDIDTPEFMKFFKNKPVAKISCGG